MRVSPGDTLALAGFGHEFEFKGPEAFGRLGATRSPGLGIDLLATNRALVSAVVRAESSVEATGAKKMTCEHIKLIYIVITE